ncbi:MAG: winged helix-turn-helix domain-containing protein [Solirubrobacterales bacterium]|nr:winged helix-turn-helix domain-containing protein [Solirubrobacterales bacterium]
MEVRRDGVPVRVGGPRQRALLALLLCNANRALSRDQLAEELLAGRLARSPERMLQVRISRLRKALSDGEEAPRLIARAPGYVLRVEAGELDLQRFEALSQQGRAALEREAPEQAALLLREAEGLWRGRPLVDLEFEPFARFEVQRLEELRLLALEDRVDAELALGRHADLCPELSTLASEYPLRERLRGQLMLALYRSGRQAEALAAYRQTSEMLREDLGLDPSRALQQLERSILQQDESLERGPRTVTATREALPEVCPFKGLEFFDVADAQYFCGRERLVSELLGRAAESGLVGMVGASGVGKSSLLRAGVLAALGAGEIPGSAGWRQVLVRPGDRPRCQLTRALGGERLESVLAALSPGERLVIAVDQLEELFTSCEDEDERAAFLETLSVAACDVGQRALVLVALRGDFYAPFASYPDFAELLSRQHALVGPMDRGELSEAIEWPAARAGLEIERPLVDALASDAAGQGGGLPLLSAMLMELWHAREGRLLRYESYRVSGGMRAAVARLAEAAYGRLEAPQRQVARSLMLRLAGEHDGALVRRRAPVAELERIDGANPVVSALIDARLLTLSDGRVELSHEALLHGWPRYRGWLEEDQAGRRLHAHLSAAAAEWEAAERDRGELYRGARLASALDWDREHPDRLNSLEREFLDSSSLESERAARRRRALVGGSFAVAVVAVGLLIFALISRGQAAAAARTAKSRALAAESQTQLSVDPERSILLAAAAMRTSVTPQAMFALRAAIDASPIRFRLPDVAAQPCGVGARYAPLLFSPGVAFSPNGSQVAEALCDGTVVLASGRSGRVVRRVHLGRGLAGQLTYNRASSLLVAVGGGRVLAIDPGSGAVRERGPAMGTYTDLASNPSAPVVAFAGRRGVTFWNLRTRAVRTLALPGGLTAGTLAFSPDGRRLAVALTVTAPDQPIVALVLDARTGRIIAALHNHSQLQVDALAFSPDGRELVSGEYNLLTGRGAIVLRDARTLAMRRVVAATIDQPAAVAFSPDGSRIAYGTAHGTTALVSTASGQVIVSYPGQTAAISQIAFSPDGRLVMTGSTDGTVRVWRGQGLALRSATVNGQIQTVVPLSAGFASIQSTPSGVTARLWSRALRAAAPPLTLSPNATPGVVLARSGPLAGVSTGTAGSKGRILIWNVLKRREIDHVPTTPSPGQTPVVSPDGRIIAMTVPAGAGWAIGLLDTRTGRFRTLARTSCSTGPHLAFNNDGRLIAAGGACGEVEVWNVASGRRVGRPVTVGTAQIGPGLAFSPDGRQLAIPAADDTVTVINPLTGAPLAVLTDHTRGVYGAAYSPDGRYLATASADHATDIYDAHTFKLLRVIHDPTVLYGAIFTPNSQDLLTWDSAGVITKWDACTDCQNPRALLALAANRVTRQLTPAERRNFGVG